MYTQATGFTNFEFYNQGGGGHTPSASCGLVKWISASWGHALIDL